MLIKNFVVQLISRLSFTRQITIRFSNKLRLHGNQMIVSNLHFRSNVVEMMGKNQTVICPTSSYLQGCIIRMHEGEGNEFRIGDSTTVFGEKRQTVYICGNDNKIIVGSGCRLNNTSSFIRGSGNTIIMGNDCSTYNVEFHVEQDRNTIQVGTKTTMHGRDSCPIHIAVDEGSGVYIADDCMLAHSIQMRSTDSHSIVDENGKRLNPARDIRIGRHCWLGILPE